MTERGAGYLDGVTLAYPGGIGSEEAAILVAGRASAWEIGEPARAIRAGSEDQELSTIIKLWR